MTSHTVSKCRRSDPVYPSTSLFTVDKKIAWCTKITLPIIKNFSGASTKFQKISSISRKNSKFQDISRSRRDPVIAQVTDTENSLSNVWRQVRETVLVHLERTQLFQSTCQHRVPLFSGWVPQTGFVANSKYKIQALFEDQNCIFQAPKLLTKSHILDAYIQNSDCNVTLKYTVLYSPIP